MRSKDKVNEVPDWVLIDASLESFSMADQFGHAVENLVKELKSRNVNSVWTKRLALYEVARRKAFLRSFTSMADIGLNGLLLERFTLAAINRLTSPGKVVHWEGLDDEIRGKRVVLEHGSYANVPTMAHVGYVNYGTVGQLGADINIISLDSTRSIKGIKGRDKIVLADDLRTTFWKHIPGVDIVTITPDFDVSNPRKFWTEMAYPKFTKVADRLLLMCSFGDQIAQEKMMYARLGGKLDVRVVYRDNWNREFGSPLFPQWTTTQWDQLSEDHQEFEQLARQYLVE